MQKIKKIFYLNIFIFIVVVALSAATGFVILKTVNVMPVNADDEDKIPPNIFNINVSEISATSTVVTWETDELSDSLINYGLDKNYGISRDPRADKLQHTLFLENLLSDTEYHFRITSSDEGGNQGISSDFSFVTEKTEEEIKEEFDGYQQDILEKGKGGLNENVLEEGNGGLKEAVEEEGTSIERIKKLIEEEVTSEEDIEEIIETVQKKAEDILLPPTIILDSADVEVGTDYAIIYWQTDKESNSMVSLIREADYNDTLENPYSWNEGQPDELKLEHVVEVNGLSPGTVYHFQVSSKSEVGLTGKSADKTFKTKSILPEISNVQITKIEEESATIRWTTNVPCSTIVEYTNLNNNEKKLEGNSSFLSIHSMRLSNLIFDTYYSVLIKVESEDGEKAESIPLTFITTRDKFPPSIAKVNTESTIYPGSDNKIQTIASWETDEPASCQLFYHQGLVVIDEPDSLLKENEFGTRHVEVITNFVPSSVYKYWIICEDEAENEAKSDDFTMLTPTQEESIIDIIIKNFEQQFSWLKRKK